MKSKLKVVIVVTIHECVPRYLANTLERMPRDYEVCVIGQNVSTYKYKYPEVKWFDVNIQRKISIYPDIRSLFVLYKFFRAYKPDIVHSIMPKSGLLSALAGYFSKVPVRIHTFTGQVWTNKVGLFRALLYYSDKLVNKLNTICLTDGPAQSLFLHRNNISENGKPLRVLLKGTLSGININRFKRDVIDEKAEDLRKELGIDRSTVVFSFIARKNRVKGAIDVLEAFANVSNKFPRSRLLFIGPDESEGEIEKLIKFNPNILDNVINIGAVTNHELYLAVSNVNCLPSYREGFSTITLEAAALGVPTIGSNIPGIMDAIEDGRTGILFSVGDLGELTQAMLFVLENPDVLIKLGNSAKIMVESQYSADQLYEALRLLYFSEFEKYKGI